MEIKDFQKKMSFNDLLGKAGGDLNVLTKGLIIALLSSGKEEDKKKGEQLKKDYLESVIAKSYTSYADKNDKERINAMLKMEEFDLEVQQLKVKILKEKLEGK